MNRKRDDYQSVIDADIEAEFFTPDNGETQEKCPRCGAKLKWRHGAFPRSNFLGCSKFPKCAYTSYR